MPKIRYTPAEMKRLAASLIEFYEIRPDDPPEVKKEKERRLFLEQWAIYEDVPSTEVFRLSKRSKLLLHSYKKVYSICEMRLALLMIEEPKRSIPIIFSMKNKFKWRDDPDAAKAKSQNKLTLQLMLPAKQGGTAGKSLAGIATATVIDDGPSKPKSKRFQVKELPPKAESKVRAKQAKNEEKRPVEATKPVTQDSASDSEGKPSWMGEE